MRTWRTRAIPRAGPPGWTPLQPLKKVAANVPSDRATSGAMANPFTNGRIAGTRSTGSVSQACVAVRLNYAAPS
eukprot:6873339-Lingulodinium_polyedra.AAC.1